jgi:hypothetical protein
MLFAASHYYFYSSANSAIGNSDKVFKISGDIVDEKGVPLDIGGIAVSEGVLVSPTQTKTGYRTVPTTGGKFDVETVPCEGVQLGFGMPGYQWQKEEFGDTRRVPKSLHIVMCKDVPPVEPSPVGMFEINAVDHHWNNPAYLTVVLDLMADGTVTAVTTLPDKNTKVNGKGKWTKSDDPLPHRVNCTIEQNDNGPDPAHIYGRPLELILSTKGDELMQAAGGPGFYRVK